MMPATKSRPLVSIVKDAPRPRLADRGRLVGIDELQTILPPYKGKPRSRWWFGHSFLPAKRIKIGRDSAWWENDVLEAIDRGDLG